MEEASSAGDGEIPSHTFPRRTVLALSAACAFFVVSLLVALAGEGSLWPSVLLRGGSPASFSSGMTPIGLGVTRYLVASASLSVFLVLLVSLAYRRCKLGSRVVALSVLYLIVLTSSFLLPDASSVLVGGVAGTLALAAVVVASDTCLRTPTRSALALTCSVGLGALAVVETGSALRWISNGFDGQSLFVGWGWALSYLDLQLTGIVSAAMPQIVLLFLASWPLRLLSSFYIKDILGFLGWGRAPSPADSDRAPLVPSAAVPLLAAVSLAFVVFVGVYPYLPAVNPRSILVGTDVAFNGYYVNNLNAMLAVSPAQAISQVAGSDRFLLLAVQYAVAAAVGSPGVALRVMPAILGAVFVGCTFAFAAVGGEDKLVAAISALFASTSIVITAGVNGGLYANWLAAGLALLTGALLLRALDRFSIPRMLAVLGSSVALLFTHTWTWLVMLAVIVCFLLVTVMRNIVAGERLLPSREASVVAPALAVNLAAFLLRSMVPQAGAAAAVGSTIARIDPGSLLQVYPTLLSNFQYFLGGGLITPLLFALAALGLFSIGDYRSSFNRFLLSWAIVGAAGILFTQFSFEFVQARVLLVLPLQVFGAIGFISLLRAVTWLAQSLPLASPSKTRAIQVLLFIAVYGAFVSYALRNVGVLYTGT